MIKECSYGLLEVMSWASPRRLPRRDVKRVPGDSPRDFPNVSQDSTLETSTDLVLSVYQRLKKNPGPKQTWQEAKTILGRGQGANKLPNVTTNSNPQDTADKFFIDKISNLSMGWPLKIEVPRRPPETPPETMSTQQPVREKFSFTFATAGSVAKIIKGLKNTSALGIDSGDKAKTLQKCRFMN